MGGGAQRTQKHGKQADDKGLGLWKALVPEVSYCREVWSREQLLLIYVTCAVCIYCWFSILCAFFQEGLASWVTFSIHLKKSLPDAHIQYLLPRAPSTCSIMCLTWPLVGTCSADFICSSNMCFLTIIPARGLCHQCTPILRVVCDTHTEK